MRLLSPKLLAAIAIVAVIAISLTVYASTRTGEEPTAFGPGDQVEAEAEAAALDEDRGIAEDQANEDQVNKDKTNDVQPEQVKSDETASRFQSDDAYWWIWADAAAIRMAWTDSVGEPFGQLELGRRSIEADGTSVVAITNGGIYQPGLIPAGLYIEAGRELVPLNRANGEGNFHLQPNGVFAVSGATATVVATAEFADGVAADRFGTIDYAVQSGPMLVIDGNPNPSFSSDSTSTYIRNAVGVDDDGRVLLIRSRRAVTMRGLADQALGLGATNVLYLDGSLSRLDGVQPGRPLVPNIPVASMIAVVDIDSASED